MDAYTAETTLKKQWMTQWGSVGGGIPYVFDNDPQPEADPSYVRFRVKLGRRTQETIGAHPKFRQNAIVEIQVNVPDGAGTKLSSQLCALARATLERKRLGVGGDESVICYIGDWSEGGTDGQYFRRTVTVPCWWTET